MTGPAASPTASETAEHSMKLKEAIDPEKPRFRVMHGHNDEDEG